MGFLLLGAGVLAPVAVSRAEIQNEFAPEQVRKWCADLRSSVQELKWALDPCAQGIQWKVGGHSVEGRPLVYAEFGSANSTNTTLILSTVHGDEITPLYLGLELANWLKVHQREYANTRVVVAPLVNPDGFFHKPRTRMNARGVDVNRNFDTSDWSSHALANWKGKFHSDPRRYPGPKPRSEPETIFQEELLQRIRPQKILSIHSPLNFIDYDGPTAMQLAKFPQEYVRVCLKLRARLRAITSGYFPGSLGNYAGHELGIPTMTLELPTSDAKKAEHYWQYFSKGIKTMIEFAVPNYASRSLVRTGS
ncbi:MAG: M14 family zinc carboxypeptidase [Bdellovibrionota bacterium]